MTRDFNTVITLDRMRQINTLLPAELRTSRIVLDPFLPEVLESISADTHIQKHVIAFTGLDTVFATALFLKKNGMETWHITDNTPEGRLDVLQQFYAANGPCALVLTRAMLRHLAPDFALEGSDISLHSTSYLSNTEWNLFRRRFCNAALGHLLRGPQINE